MLSRERGVYALSFSKLFSLSIAIVIRSSACRPLLANASSQAATLRYCKTRHCRETRDINYEFMKFVNLSLSQRRKNASLYDEN